MTLLKPGMKVSTWAKENGTHYRWFANLDNHDPVRDIGSGDIYWFDVQRDVLEGSRAWNHGARTYQQCGYILFGADQLRNDGRGNTLYIVTDGETQRVFYVAGWHPEGEHVLLHPLSADFHAIGPHNAYHLHISKQ